MSSASSRPQRNEQPCAMKGLELFLEHGHPAVARFAGEFRWHKKTALSERERQID
jgi:hypothetical protein